MFLVAPARLNGSVGGTLAAEGADAGPFFSRGRTRACAGLVPVVVRVGWLGVSGTPCDASLGCGAWRTTPGRYCLMLASNLLSSAVAGSNLPPKYFARNSSEAALKAMLLVGRAKPCPSSGKT